MGTLLQVIGFGWALLGAANFFGTLSSGATEGISAFSLVFNTVLFIMPGLVVGGLGSLLKKRSQPVGRAPEQVPVTPPPGPSTPADFSARRAEEKALLRRDAWRMLKWGLVGMVVLLLIRAAASGSSSSYSPTTAASGTQVSSASLVKAQRTASAEIVDWNWYSDPDFGTDGAVIWTVKVRNNSSDYMQQVKVEFTTYDKADKLITTEFTYVSGIPPGEARSDKSYATYFGTEKKANVVVTDVY